MEYRGRIHSFSEYLFSTFYVPVSYWVQQIHTDGMNEEDTCIHRASILAGKTPEQKEHVII